MPVPKGGARRRRRPEPAPDDEALVSLVAREFCKGQQTLSQIAKRLGISREQTYPLLRWAASSNRFRYVPPLEEQLSSQLHQEHSWLTRVEVIQTSVAADIAHHTAALLMELIGEHRQQHPDSREIHIGFAGGYLLREAARLFARSLQGTTEDLEGFAFCFHAMVAGFNPLNPMEDPNAFFVYLADGLPVESRFVRLLAPGLVTPEVERTLKPIEGIKEAYQAREKLDIVVSSAGAHWDKGCSRLHKLYSERGATQLIEDLTGARCIGDMIWRPVGRTGPIHMETRLRAMTLLDPSELPGFLQEGKKVLLALGPCYDCGKPKGEILDAVLRWKPRHISHLVVDTGSVYEMRDLRHRRLRSRHPEGPGARAASANGM